MHQSVTFDELVALYAVSDACLVSSTRDGMNLASNFVNCLDLYTYTYSFRSRMNILLVKQIDMVY
jgi:hypothetical protein